MFGLFKKSDAEICMDNICDQLLSNKEELTNLILKFKDQKYEVGHDNSKSFLLNGTAVRVNDLRNLFLFILAEEIKKETGIEVENYSDKLRIKFKKNVKTLIECSLFMHGHLYEVKLRYL